MAPGCPSVAAKYAIEDAKVDHGSGEGTYAAAFVAAMQSAAFAAPDLRLCIDLGLRAIPEDWRAYIGDELVSCAIHLNDAGYTNCKTCTELTERVMAQAPHMLFENDAAVALTDGEAEMPEHVTDFLSRQCDAIAQMCRVTPYSMYFDNLFFEARVSLSGAPDIAPMGEIGVEVELSTVLKRLVLGRIFYNVSVRWWLPDGFSVEGIGKCCFCRPRIDAMTEPAAIGRRSAQESVWKS